MSIGALLDEIRSFYLKRFLEAVRESRSRPGVVSVVIEAAMSDMNGEAVSEGALDVPMRLDIALIGEDRVAQSITIDTERMIAFDPIDFEWGDSLSVSLRPFQWNYCEVNVVPSFDASGLGSLAAWFRHWFVERDPEAEPLEVVHFISDPEKKGSGQRFYVDFGTAPVDALEQLLDVCAHGGAKKVRLGRKVRSPGSGSGGPH